MLFGKSNINIGMQAPDFQLPDQDSTIHKLSDYIGSMVVLYFFPMADTPGWTKEACGFRDKFEIYERAIYFDGDSTGNPGWLTAYVYDQDGYPIQEAHVSVWNDEFDTNSMTNSSHILNYKHCAWYFPELDLPTGRHPPAPGIVDGHLKKSKFQKNPKFPKF